MASFSAVGDKAQRLALLSPSPPPDFTSLCRIILTCVDGGGGHQLASLQLAISSFETFMRQTNRRKFDFFSDLLPHIHTWALAAETSEAIDLPLLRAGTSKGIRISRGRIRSILANSFFSNVSSFAASQQGTDVPTRGQPGFGNINLMGLYTSKNALAKERLICLLAYFELAIYLQPQELDDKVVFARHVLLECERPCWLSLDMKIDVDCIRVHKERMENSNAEGIMDFANKALHIHKIIPSATQEEILFSACPESFVGILFCEVLGDSEAIIIENVRRFVEYTGYASTFRFAGFYPNPRFHAIVVADATTTNQFADAMLDRDLKKAYLGFRQVNPVSTSLCSAIKISTSHWGCGAFGGDKTLKFLQQVCASAVAGVHLDYSTFGDCQMEAKFKELLRIIRSDGHTVGSVYHAMSGFRERGVFFDYVVRKLMESRVN